MASLAILSADVSMSTACDTKENNESWAKVEQMNLEKKECEYSPNRKGKQKESKSPNRVWKMWPDKKVISKTTM